MLWKVSEKTKVDPSLQTDRETTQRVACKQLAGPARYLTCTASTRGDLCITPFNHRKQKGTNRPARLLLPGLSQKYTRRLLIFICSSRRVIKQCAECLATHSFPLSSNFPSLMITLFLNLIMYSNVTLLPLPSTTLIEHN